MTLSSNDPEIPVDITPVEDFTLPFRGPINLPARRTDKEPTLLDRGDSLYSMYSVPIFKDITSESTWVMPALHIDDKRAVKKTEETDYISLMRNLIKSSGIYALASLTSPLVSLVLAPFLTNHLSRTDYGALAVLSTVISLVAGFTQLGLSSAFFRLYNYDYENERDRSGVISMVVIMLLFTSLPILFASLIAAPALANILLGKASFGNDIKLAALAIFTQNLSVPGLAWLRAESRAIFFSILSISQLVVVLLINIILVGMMRFGISGSIIATASGYGVMIVGILPLILLRLHLRLRLDIIRELLTFGLPNVANFLSIWILQLSDRYLLTHFTSLAQTAGYAVAYSLGGVLSTVIITPFSLAWPTAMYSIAKKKEAPALFRLVFRWFGLLLLFAAYGFSLVSIGLLNLFFPYSYRSSAPVIPIIAASIVFYGVYLIFNIGISVRRKPWWAVVLTTSAAIANVVLNIILIPYFGSIGAALSTLIAYIILAAFAYIVNQKIYPIPFEIMLFIALFSLGVLSFIISSLLVKGLNIYLTGGIYSGFLCLYGGCLVIFGKVPQGWLKRSHS